MNVAIYGKKINKQTAPHYIHFISIIKDLGWNPILEKDLKEQLIKKVGIASNYEEFSSYKNFKQGIDLAVSIGGDGTFINTVSFIRDSEVPILGINTGRLGFLANIPIHKMEETMDMVKRKEYVYQKRSLLRVETENNLFGDDNIALNEATLHKKDTASMITVHASLDGNYLNSYWADGLIVGTPTGSTAYNLSCGGPIITPGCQVHLLTPIAPHNLNVRPMVVPDHMPIQLKVEGRDRKYLLTLDGNSKNISQGQENMIQKADFMVNVIKLNDNNFLDTIRNKMMWGLDKRNEN